MKTVLVPLDGSAHATVALPVARVLAELEGASLRVLHVGEPLLPPRELLDRLGLTPEQVRGLVVDQATGPPAASIVRLARDWRSGLIVLCTHTGAARPRGALGTVAEQVLRGAPCPVVLVRPARGPRTWALRRIVLPLDGTPTTAASVGPAVDLAQRSGAGLDVLHVPVPDPLNEPGTLTMPQYLDQPQHDWPLWAVEFLARTRSLCGCPPSVQMWLFVRRGVPEAEIRRFTQERAEDLIVLAWRGRMEPKRARIMRRVLRDAPCPVLVLRVGETTSDSGAAPTGPTNEHSAADRTEPHSSREGGDTP